MDLNTLPEKIKTSCCDKCAKEKNIQQDEIYHDNACEICGEYIPKMFTRQNLKDQVFLNMAFELSKLGTCCRLKVGVILLRKDGSIASGGYNGSLPGMIHCNPDTCNSKQRCLHTSHGEENALFFSTGDIHTAYVTDETCLVCTRMLARRGVKRIVFEREYKSISDQEKEERDQIISHHNISWECIKRE